jgi:methylenetetrahydrofolate dehydrogenase (NADP+)/methenyltetrahydrofolate cyclohydrolase
MAILLDGKAAAEAWRGELRVRVEALAGARGAVPGLAVVWVGENPASAVYVRNKDRAAAEAGIRSSVVHLEAASGPQALSDTLDRLAADSSVDGILLQLPLPQGYDSAPALAHLPAIKDVDGLTPENQGLLALGTPRFVPATPLGIVELLRRYQIPIAGAHAVIIGRSAIVGRPLAMLLSSRGPLGDATVTLCHSRTRDLPSITREAEILVAASGQAGLVVADMVRPGATVIDVGINRVPDPTHPGGSRLVGDVDFPAVRAVAGAITPVPGGVGPMTVAALVHNTVLAAEMRHGLEPAARKKAEPKTAARAGSRAGETAQW